MNPEINDEQLMQAAANGDLDAFNQIVLRHQAVAWSLAWRFLGDSMEAEDVAQEAFLKILEAAPRYRPKASFRIYLYRVVTRLCIDWSRKKRPTYADPLPDIRDPALSPAENLLAKERRSEIRGVLDILPPNQRMAIILRHYDGLSYTEIAETLEVTVKAVERLISRARAGLRIHWKEL